MILAALWGSKMAARYELQTEWRERYGMDEFGVARLGKAVTRGSASLPTLIMWALAPREDQGMLAQLLPTIAFLVGALGVAAILRLRTWGLLALGAAAGLALAVTFLLPVAGRGSRRRGRHRRADVGRRGCPGVAAGGGRLGRLGAARLRRPDRPLPAALAAR